MSLIQNNHMVSELLPLFQQVKVVRSVSAELLGSHLTCAKAHQCNSGSAARAFKPSALLRELASRVHGTERGNNPAQMGRAGRQEKLRPPEKCFFLDSLYGTNQDLAARLAVRSKTCCAEN
jgi:hypothetical protein